MGDKRKTGPVALVTGNGTMSDRELLEGLRKDFADHAEEDAKALADIKSATKSQNWLLSIIITIATAIGAAVHGFLGH